MSQPIAAFTPHFASLADIFTQQLQPTRHCHSHHSPPQSTLADRRAALAGHCSLTSHNHITSTALVTHNLQRAKRIRARSTSRTCAEPNNDCRGLPDVCVNEAKYGALPLASVGRAGYHCNRCPQSTVIASLIILVPQCAYGVLGRNKRSREQSVGSSTSGTLQSASDNNVVKPSGLRAKGRIMADLSKDGRKSRYNVAKCAAPTNGELVKPALDSRM